MIDHPEWLHGRRLWDGSPEFVGRLQHGYDVVGWEGDEKLALYWSPPRWEVWRLEDDGEYRMVCRSQPHALFDDRLLADLCRWDVRRRRRDLHAEVADHNEKVKARNRQHHLDYMTEEAIPRLQHALRRDA